MLLPHHPGLPFIGSMGWASRSQHDLRRSSQLLDAAVSEVPEPSPRGERTTAALSEDALPSLARAPTPASMAAARKSESAMKKDQVTASGGGMLRALQYVATYSASVGIPAWTGDSC